MNFRHVLVLGVAIVGYSLIGGSTSSCGGGEGGGSAGGSAGGSGGGRAGGSGGAGGATGGGTATGGGVATGGGSAGGGSAGGGSAGGGSAGGAAGGSAGGAAGGSAGGAAGGSAGGAGGAGGGASNSCVAPVNGCTNFDDRTSAGASRTVALTTAFTIDPPCIRIRSGQTVNFVSQSASHPGGQTCGPSNADMVINVPGGGTQNVTFTTTGLYGFVCTFHPIQMRGAIDVVP